MNNDGTLTMDSTTLQSELDSNYSGVKSFFESTTSSSFSGSFNNLLTNLTDPTNSAVTLDLSGLKSNYTQDQTNVSNLETQLTALQATLTTQYSALNTTLQMYPTDLMEVETELGYRTTTNSSSSS
jgi:flagellar hook-associated protein 2